MLPPAPEDPARTLLLELLGQPASTAFATQAASAEVDWTRLLQLAGPALQPMLALRTAERRIPIPPAVRARLHGARRAAAMLHARRRFALGRVFAAFDAAGIPFVVLKGYALAHTVYPSPEARVMSDVDLWLGGADLRTAAQALEPLGWQIPWWHKGHGRFFDDGQVGLRFGSTALMIELHRQPASLAESIPGELERIWSRRISIDLGGCTGAVLAFDDTLLHLGLHLAEHHRFVNAIGRLLDITLAVSAAGPSFDWAGFAKRSRALRVQSWMAVTLGTAKALLHADIPDEALQHFEVRDLPALVAMACDQVWLSDRSAVAPSSVLAAPTRRARARRIGQRIGELLFGQRPDRRPDFRGLGYRLRSALQLILPALARTLWRGTYSGESGVRLRRLSEENRVLAETLRRQAIADGATPR